jgi:hypothetical protein
LLRKCKSDFMVIQRGLKQAKPNWGLFGTAGWLAAVVLLVAMGGGGVQSASGSGGTGAAAASAGVTGPTLRLGYGHRDRSTNSIATFMYFVPLISPEPVSATTSPGSTQSARLTSATRKQRGNSFTTTCDFEFTGDGSQQNTFDMSRKIRRHEQQLKAGGTLKRQLASITVTGPGRGQVEIEGIVTNGIRTVTEVKMRFNAQGQTSPVSIGLCDIRYQGGDFRSTNEIVARVSTLTFRRKAGQPKMEVTVASVKKKGAGSGWWQNLKGNLKGAAANMLIDPLAVEPDGQRAVLDFGQALAAGAPNFTFPRAKNLKAG